MQIISYYRLLFAKIKLWLKEDAVLNKNNKDKNNKEMNF